MTAKAVELQLGYRWPGIRDACTGDDNVKVTDAVIVLQLLDGGQGVHFNRGVDDDELAAFTLGQFGQRLR